MAEFYQNFMVIYFISLLEFKVGVNDSFNGFDMIATVQFANSQQFGLRGKLFISNLVAFINVIIPGILPFNQNSSDFLQVNL